MHGGTAEAKGGGRTQKCLHKRLGKNIWPMLVQIRRVLGDSEPILAEIGPTLAEFGPTWSMSGPFRPIPGQCWRNLTELGQMLADFRPMLDNPGPKLADMGQVWVDGGRCQTKFGRNQAPCLAEIGTNLVEVGQIRSITGEVRPTLAHFGPTLVQTRPVLDDAGQIWTILGRMCARFGRHRKRSTDIRRCRPHSGCVRPNAQCGCVLHAARAPASASAPGIRAQATAAQC